jgi:chemotaxis protein MotB
MARSARVPKGSRHHHEEHEEHVNHEAWVIPYADMLTLLMGLFLVLWAISNQDLAKLKQFGEGFGAAVGMASPVSTGERGSGAGEGLLDGNPPPTTIALSADEQQNAVAALQRERLEIQQQAVETATLARAEAVIVTAATSAGAQQSVSFEHEDRGLVVSIVSDDVLFDPGSAQLRRDGLAVLDAVAGGLAVLPNTISIEGHTDSVPIATDRYPSNWELSTARSSAVLRYLSWRHGVPVGRMVAGGYADQQPRGDNTTVDGRALNRRVDLVVMSTAEAPTPTEADAPADPGPKSASDDATGDDHG